MCNEATQPEPTELPEPKPVSKQVTANRANARKSTGPRTVAGKAKSRRNALKHGCCARIIDVPDEDPDVFHERIGFFNKELNPMNSEVNALLIVHAVRASIGLDRCFSVQTARVAHRCREAVRVLDEKVAKEAENELLNLTYPQAYLKIKTVSRTRTDVMKVGPPPQPGHAVRRLKTTSHGCNALIREWEMLRTPLVDPPSWDTNDFDRAVRLMGHSAGASLDSCNPLAVPLKDIATYRRVADKYDFATRQDVGYFHGYPQPGEKEYDELWLPKLAVKSKEAIAFISQFIDDQQASLVATRDALLPREELDRAEASDRARFDSTDEGKLICRYVSEQQRGLLKIVETLKKETKEFFKEQREQEVASNRQARDLPPQSAKTTPPASRNEPISGGSGGPSKGASVVESDRKVTSRRGKRDRKQPKNQR